MSINTLGIVQYKIVKGWLERFTGKVYWKGLLERFAEKVSRKVYWKVYWKGLLKRFT